MYGKTLTAGVVANISTGLTANPNLLSGVFSVNGESHKVRFSRGNLQATYNGSAWSWAFAEHQWDYIGNAAAYGNYWSSTNKGSDQAYYLYFDDALNVEFEKESTRHFGHSVRLVKKQ